jgi:hypothetical protein
MRCRTWTRTAQRPSRQRARRNRWPDLRRASQGASNRQNLRCAWRTGEFPQLQESWGSQWRHVGFMSRAATRLTMSTVTQSTRLTASRNSSFRTVGSAATKTAPRLIGFRITGSTNTLAGSRRSISDRPLGDRRRAQSAAGVSINVWPLPLSRFDPSRGRRNTQSRSVKPDSGSVSSIAASCPDIVQRVPRGKVGLLISAISHRTDTFRRRNCTVGTEPCSEPKQRFQS